MIRLLLLVALALPAVRAELTYCNRSGDEMNGAVTYYESGRWKSVGWLNLKPGECKDILTGDLNNRYYYSYGVSVDGSKVWGGDYPMCIRTKAFQAGPKGKCVVRGFDETAGFHQIDTSDARSFVFDFK